LCRNYLPRLARASRRPKSGCVPRSQMPSSARTYGADGATSTAGASATRARRQRGDGGLHGRRQANALARGARDGTIRRRRDAWKGAVSPTLMLLLDARAHHQTLGPRPEEASAWTMDALARGQPGRATGECCSQRRIDSRDVRGHRAGPRGSPDHRVEGSCGRATATARFGVREPGNRCAKQFIARDLGRRSHGCIAS